MLTTGWQIVRSKASYTTQSGQKSHNQWLHVSLAFDASLVREDTQEEIERRQADAERRAKLARLAEVEVASLDGSVTAAISMFRV